MLNSRWKVLRLESYLWYRDAIVAMFLVTVILLNTLVWMVADGDVVDAESGEVRNLYYLNYMKKNT